MNLRWTFQVMPDGDVRVPPGPSDGDIDPADTIYPNVGAAADDLFDAVISDYLADGREVRVVLTFVQEEAAL